MDRGGTRRGAAVSVRTLIPDARQDGALHASWTFDARDPKAPAHGRTRVRLLLQAWRREGHKELAADLETIVTELITNVYQHAGVPVGAAALTWGEDLVTAWVSDQGPGTPRPMLEPEAPKAGWDWSGWGLALVRDVVAEYDGSLLIRTSPDGCGKCVIARLRLKGAER